MGWTTFTIILSLAAAYAVLVTVGLMAMRGEAAVDPLWPTLAAVAVLAAVTVYGW